LTIYLDTSVLLARVQAEGRQPPDGFFEQQLVSSRLIEYEAWSRVHARRLAETAGVVVDKLLARVHMVELAPPVLRFVKEPWPTPVRALDALHLSTLRHLVAEGLSVELASYDDRMSRAAEALGLPLAW